MRTNFSSGWPWWPHWSRSVTKECRIRNHPCSEKPTRQPPTTNTQHMFCSHLPWSHKPPSSTAHDFRPDLKWNWVTKFLSNQEDYDVTSSSRFGSWGSERTWDQLCTSQVHWHELTWVRMVQELKHHCNVTGFCLHDASAQLKSSRTSTRHASTVPPHVNPAAQHSGGQSHKHHNWDEPMRTLGALTRNSWC